MLFRSSPYIDFASGAVKKPPMQLVQERQPPRSPKDLLDLFECRVDVWQLGPAVHILRQMEANSDQSSVWAHTDRKSTRLNSSHQIISYAVFCLKKKKKQNTR